MTPVDDPPLRTETTALDDAALDDAALDAWIDAGTAALGIGLQPEWRLAVRTQLRISLGHAAAVLDAELPDDLDPAPVFRA